MARILVVDDEHNIRTMVRLALRHVGHEVETAPDGAEGLAKFGDGSGWDAVLLDQRMPGMEGLAVLREMRERDPQARILMITAFGTIDLAVQAMKAGATDFLRKPFTADTLRGAVQAALAGTPAAAPSPPDSFASVTYAMTTLNGFRIESEPRPAMRVNGDIQHVFTVRSPTDEVRQVTVQLPVYLLEQVKAETDREEMPGGERFWQALCEEALANYLWQHAELPPDAPLRVEDLTTGLRRWVDSVLAAIG